MYGECDRLLGHRSSRGETRASHLKANDLAVAVIVGDARLLEQALLARGRRVTLVQHSRAEVDPVVAAASIVARAEFLDRLAALGTGFGIPLPKTAGAPVLAAARAIVARHAPEAVGKVAKLHFSITHRVIPA